MTLQVIAIMVFGFYGRRPGEDPRIGNVSSVLGVVAVLTQVWLFAAYFGLAHLLPNPVIAQKIQTLVADIWVLSCAILLIRTKAGESG
jgi:hypothetical protein